MRRILLYAAIGLAAALALSCAQPYSPPPEPTPIPTPAVDPAPLVSAAAWGLLTPDMDAAAVEALIGRGQETTDDGARTWRYRVRRATDTVTGLVVWRAGRAQFVTW